MMRCACHHQPHLPCLNCQPQSFIAMVQHLIERCLLFRMTKDDCIKALAKHASIQPLVTNTVWKELVKENDGFFQAYDRATSARHNKSNERVLKATTMEVNRKGPCLIRTVNHKKLNYFPIQGHI